MTETATLIRRIVVALDGSKHSEAALEAAARLGSILGAELSGVFVEDADVLSAAALPFSREVGRLTSGSTGLSSSTMRSQFRAQERQARKAFEWATRKHRLINRFEVAHGSVADELIRAAERADLITVGQSGSVSASRQKLGRVAREVLECASGPVLVLRRGLRLDLPVIVVYDCRAKDRIGALKIGAALDAHHYESPLIILLAAESSQQEESARLEVLNHLKGHLPPPKFERIRCDVPDQILDSARRHRAGVLIVPAHGGANAPELRHLVSRADVPVMVVRG